MHEYQLRDKYVWVDARHVDEITPITNRELWTTIEQVTSEFGVYRILVHGGARRRSMGFIDVYRTAESPIKDHIRSLQVAFYMPHDEPDEFTEVFVSMAAEGGHRIRFFRDDGDDVH